MSERVFVSHLAGADERHRLDAPVRMIGKARLIVGRFGRLEMVEKQKRVQIVETASPDTAPQVNPGAFDDRFRRDDPGHGA